LGVTDDCPEFADYPNPATDPIEHELAGEAVQVLPGGRFLIEGLVTVTRADTVPQAQYPRLRDTGVPFIHVDSTVQNSYPYYYAVTAFDINSRASGPASLESPLVVKSIVPRRDAANLTEAALEMGLYGRGQALDQRATFTFDATTGTFSGAPPPTKLLSVAAAELFLPTLVLAGARIELRVDSVVPSYYEGDYYLTLDQNGQTTSLHYTGLPVTSHDHYWPRLFDPIEVPIPTDPALADTTGQPGVPYAGRAAFAFGVRAVTPYSGDAEWHEDVDGAFWYSDRLTGLGPSRWFSGDDESTPYGGYYWRGALDGVNVIHSPQPNYSGGLPDGPLTAPVYALFRRLRQATWAVARQADVKFYWGHLPGTLDSVVDVTHNVRVPFISSGQYGVGWGFRDDIAGRSTTYAPPDGVVTEYDFAFGPCFPEGLPSHTVGACATRPFVNTAVLQPVDIDGDGAADGDGFALYFNHEFYLFQTDALPANTVWTHRSHFGVTAGTPGDYTFTPWDANPVVPGLTARHEVLAAATTRAVTTDDLAHVHTVPDPFYGSSALQPSPSDRVITFVNLPERAIIRIYSVSGVLVDVIEHYDPALGGEATWDARNRNGRVVASGVYFYHVETPDGAETIGRMSVIIGSNIGVPR
jgi:hypothetical protein